METAVLFTVALFLAYANGANDNAKGVATLYGSGVLGYRAALTLAALATFAGGIAALFLAQGLVAGFSGKGLVAPETAASPAFAAAVGSGAAATVGLATRLGLPVSTTHALVGGLLGAGLLAPGPVAWSHLGGVFLLPLLVSPFLAGGLGLLVYRLLPRGVSRGAEGGCLCLEAEVVPAGPSARRRVWPGLRLGRWEVCRRRPGVFWAGRLPPPGDGVHVLSAAAVSFGRGLNDTPKIAALLLLAPAPGPVWGMTAVAVGMALGGLLAERRVGTTLGWRITPLDRDQGRAASLATAALVLSAGGLALPVSTTHVSVGALWGIGLWRGEACHRVLRGIVLAWFVTLPLALVLSALASLLFSTTGIAG